MSIATRFGSLNPSSQVTAFTSGTVATPSAKRSFDTSAFEFIAGHVLESETSSLSFTGIPGTYKTLHIRTTARSNGGQGDLNFRFNSDTGNNYHNHLLTFYASNVNAYSQNSTSSTRSACLLTGDTSTAQPLDCFGVGLVWITDYASSTKKKAGKSYCGHAGAYRGGEAQWFDFLWTSTNAITSIEFIGTLRPGSRIDLYGIA